jgi:hypothetical protein
MSLNKTLVPQKAALPSSYLFFILFYFYYYFFKECKRLFHSWQLALISGDTWALNDTVNTRLCQ